MIKLQDLTPTIYYNDSRDFQFIGRLYDIVLNYLKTEATNLYNLPCGKNMNEKLLNLLSLTLGFKAKHNYNAVQLEAICSVLPLVLKNKGSLNAIIIAVTALSHAEGIKQALDYHIEPKKNIVLYLPEQLSDLSLLEDLLSYILPAGIGCRLVKEISERHTIITEITTTDTVTIYGMDDTIGYNPARDNRLLKLKGNNAESLQDIENLTTGGQNGKPGMIGNATIGDTYVGTLKDKQPAEDDTGE